jgi:hypothetical protein
VKLTYAKCSQLNRPALNAKPQKRQRSCNKLETKSIYIVAKKENNRFPAEQYIQQQQTGDKPL